MANIENLKSDYSYQNRLFMTWAEKAVSETDQDKKGRYFSYAQVHLKARGELERQLEDAGMETKEIQRLG